MEKIIKMGTNKVISILVVIVLCCLAGCNSNDRKTCICTLDEIKQSNIGKKFFFPLSFKENGEILLNDKGIEQSKIGGEYTFYSSKKLKQYRFFTSENIYSYSEYYNENGNLDSTEGNALVITNVDEINKDSIKYNFYVSNLNKKILSFIVNLNNAEWFELKGQRDSIFSNVTRYEFSVNVTGIQNIKMYKKLIFQDCNDETKLTLDSSLINRRVNASQ